MKNTRDELRSLDARPLVTRLQEDAIQLRSYGGNTRADLLEEAIEEIFRLERALKNASLPRTEEA